VNGTLVRTENIGKSFLSVPVLQNINIEIRRGEILGVIGENGAGKSTLMKILSGIYLPSSGNVFFEGLKVDIRKPSDAKRIGISIIPQEFNLIKDLSVYDNIFLGSERVQKSRLLDKRLMKARTTELLKALGVTIPPEARIENLSAAQKQMVEICKALAFDSRLLIMDEPTTVLTKYEIDVLFRLMRRLRDQGMTIVYISHKLKEVKAICDRVIILRDGLLIDDKPIAEITPEQMAERMVGRALNQIFPPRNRPEERIALEVKNLSVPGLLYNIGFQVRQGEILGFAGLVGAGRTEIAETLIGIRKAAAGEITLEGRRIEIHNTKDTVRQGLSYLSEDRQGSGVITGFTVVQNTTLVSLPRYSGVAFGIIAKKNEKEAAGKYQKMFNIRTPSLDTRLEYLSGGNQQKVSLAKSIDTLPRILIADEPTRGIDVLAKTEIYQLIHSLAAQGIACLFISSELEEIIGMCHRVIVMKDGAITGILEGEQINEAEIMFYATGIRETRNYDGHTS
jgi:ribose transport system ATP-binding protein